MSGGQTGVDRAALDVALALGLECGGWCPSGRRAEDGAIAAHYPLRETPSPRYEERTEWNVRDSDGTLIVTRGEPTGGTALTRELALRMRRPLHVADLAAGATPAAARAWLEENRIAVLNVAGPRESGAPGIYRAARAFLEEAMAAPPPRARARGRSGAVSPRSRGR